MSKPVRNPYSMPPGPCIDDLISEVSVPCVVAMFQSIYPGGITESSLSKFRDRNALAITHRLLQKGTIGYTQESSTRVFFLSEPYASRVRSSSSSSPSSSSSSSSEQRSRPVRSSNFLLELWRSANPGSVSIARPWRIREESHRLPELRKREREAPHMTRTRGFPTQGFVISEGLIETTLVQHHCLRKPEDMED